MKTWKDELGAEFQTNKCGVETLKKAPKEIKEYTIPCFVAEIENSAFDVCCELTNLIIPNSVKRIDTFAFTGCTTLKSIIVDEANNYYKSVDGVLYDKNLKTLIKCPARHISIKIPDSVTEIEMSAFYDCTALKSITVDEANNYYKSVDGVLYDKTLNTLIQCPAGLTSVEIPDSVTEIRHLAFYKCINLADIKIPNTIKKISGFGYCISLKSIVIPDSVQIIGPSETFWGCSNLENIYIPSSVTKIGTAALAKCPKLVVHLSKRSSLKEDDFYNEYSLGDCKQVIRDLD